MFVSPCSQRSSMKHIRVKVPFLKFMAICWKYLIFSFCLSHCCLTDVDQTAVPHKKVFSMHHGNSAYIQVSNGIYENFSNCMANSRLGCEQRKSFVCSEEQWSCSRQGGHVCLQRIQGLALFKWSCHFLQQLVQTDCRK